MEPDKTYPVSTLSPSSTISQITSKKKKTKMQRTALLCTTPEAKKTWTEFIPSWN